MSGCTNTRRFRTEAIAIRELSRIRRKEPKVTPGVDPFKCSCGYWHPVKR